MRKFVLFFIFTMLLATYVYAAGPRIEEEGLIIFNAAGQTTSQSYTVYGIAWSSSSVGHIASGSSATISDGNGNVIFTSIANTAEDEEDRVYPNGLKVSGLTATTLSHGQVYINANKR